MLFVIYDCKFQFDEIFNFMYILFKFCNDRNILNITEIYFLIFIKYYMSINYSNEINYETINYLLQH